MKNSEIKSLTADELTERIATETENWSKLKFSHAISPIENPTKLRDSRKLVARLKTELRAKQLGK